MAINRRPDGGYLSLRDAMNRLFEDSYVTPYAAATGSMGTVPQADVYDNGDDYEICLSVPGVNPDDINIAAQGNSISISGEFKQHSHQHTGKTLHQEIEVGRFARSFTLPSDIDAGRAEASYDDGILRLTLPKAETAKTKKIAVKAGQSGQTSRAESVPIEGDAEAGSETKLS